MFEIGNTLREARLRRGLTVAECEVGTKVRAKYLRAIEEEHFDLLPSPAYVRGFLTTYADYLGLDGRLFMDEYESRFGPGSEMERRVERNLRAKQRRSRRSRRRGGLSTEAKLGWLGLGGSAVVGVLMMQGMGDGTQPQTPFTSAPDTQQAAAVLPPSEEAPEAVKVTFRGVGQYGSSVMIHRNSENGPVVFDGIINSGGEKSVVLDGPLWLRAYNAAGLTVTIKGKTRTLQGSTADFRIDRRGVTPVDAPAAAAAQP